MTTLPLDTRYRALSARHLDAIGSRYGIDPELVGEIKVAASVLPFRVNAHVLDALIDWSRVPDDPIFKLTFPRREMLDPRDYRAVAETLRAGLPAEALARRIRDRMNPHCSDQAANVPMLRGSAVGGLQHKYRESLLVFPSVSQTCHAVCSYCFRWPQFVDTSAGKFELRDPDTLRDYLGAHPEVTDVIYTGGDPLVASSAVLHRFIAPALEARAVRSIRIGTKSLVYWPHRFTTDADADALMRLFRDVGTRGKQLTVMAHFSHPRELQSPATRAAIARVRATGAVIRTQAPILRGINDDAATWRELWSQELGLGCVPHYAFMARDTGAHTFFDVPLARAHDIVCDAARDLPGIATTARGPLMSTSFGKIVLVGTVSVAGSRAFVLRFVRSTNRAWTGETFLARYDPAATWFDALRPFEGERFFFESGRRAWPEPPAEGPADAIGWKLPRLKG